MGRIRAKRPGALEHSPPHCYISWRPCLLLSLNLGLLLGHLSSCLSLSFKRGAGEAEGEFLEHMDGTKPPNAEETWGRGEVDEQEEEEGVAYFMASYLFEPKQLQTDILLLAMISTSGRATTTQNDI